jgi:hypothetical protein
MNKKSKVKDYTSMVVSDYNIKKSKKSTKINTIIKASKELTKKEIKIISILIEVIEEDDDNLSVYMFEIDNILETFKMDKESIIKVISKLTSRVIEVKTETLLERFHWLSYFLIDENYVYIKPDQEIRSYLLYLKKLT